MINGAHAIIYSKKADADRAFLKDVIGLDHVDAGGGWLIFGLPPSEVAVHPGPKDGVHELYLMCDDVEAFRAMLEGKKIKASAVKDQGWGLLTTVTLPGGGKLGVYQPRHPRPGMKSASSAKKPAKKPTPTKSAAKATKAKGAVPPQAKAAPSKPKKAARARR